MKNVISLMVLIVLIFSGSACFAAGDFPIYIKGLVKYTMPSDPSIEGLDVSSDDGWGWGGAVGIGYKRFRLEGEISTQKDDLKGSGSGDMRFTTYLINGYFDIPLKGGFGLYLTGGLGYGSIAIDIDDIDGNDGGFAWKGGAGAFYSFNENIAIDLGWEYVSMDDASFNREVTDLNTNNIVAAFRYTF